METITSTILAEISSIELPDKHNMDTNPDLFKEKISNNKYKIENCLSLLNDIIIKTQKDIHSVQMSLLNEIND